MVTIKVAKTRREIRDFVIFPTKLYKNDPYYVPDMVGDQINDLMPDKNPAFEYCEARCFLAYRDGKIVGRVAGILNKRANEKNDVNYLRFAFFDFIDDAEVTDALYAALADYARELGCVAIHGPQGFSDMDREGMLVEGFDKLSQFFVYYNYPYYLAHMARLGFVKEVDWVEYLIHVPDAVPPRMERIVEYTKKHMALKLVDLSDKKNLPKYLRDVFALYNEAYQVIFGMVPLTPKQIEKYTKEAGYELGIACLPTYDPEKPIVPIGGGNIGLVKPGNTEEQKQAGWEFINFLLSDEMVAYNSINSGYLPTTESVGNNAEMEAYWAENPLYKVAYDQLPNGIEQAWPDFEYNSELKTDIQSVVSLLIQEQSITPEEAVQQIIDNNAHMDLL